MKLPLLLLHNIDYDQFNNWALPLSPVRSMVNLTAFAAACVLCRPQHQQPASARAKARLAHAQSQSRALTAHQHRTRICACSGIAGVLALRLTIPPRNFRPPQNRDVAGQIRGRVGGLRLLACLVVENIYASNCDVRDGDSDCSDDNASFSSSESCFGSDASSSSGGGSSSSSFEHTCHIKRRKE